MSISIITWKEGANIDVEGQQIANCIAVLRAIQAARIHLEQGAFVTIDPSRQRILLRPIWAVRCGES